MLILQIRIPNTASNYLKIQRLQSTVRFRREKPRSRAIFVSGILGTRNEILSIHSFNVNYKNVYFSF
jgi:hypothetical protein